MSDLSPYPREKPTTLARVRWTDRIAAGLLAGYVLVSLGAAFLADGRPADIVMGVIGLVPAGLLLIPRPLSMFLVTFMSLPCCLGASWYADGMQIPQISDKMLYDGCPFILIIGLYAFFRCIQLAALTRNQG